MKTVFFKKFVQKLAVKFVPNLSRGFFHTRSLLVNRSQKDSISVEYKKMRTLKFRPAFPSCMNRKVSDEPPVPSLEIGDFPLQVLEYRRKERLEELKAECLDLKHQLSEHSLQAALLKEELANENAVNANSNDQGPRVFSGRHSKSMHELRRLPQRQTGESTFSVFCEESHRKRREERLETIRRELEEFAIKYSIGEFAEKIEGLEKSPLKKSKSVNFAAMRETPSPDSPEGYFTISGPIIKNGVTPANASILLRIQRKREQELQRARLELKQLAFRLKHKLDEENISPISPSFDE